MAFQQNEFRPGSDIRKKRLNIKRRSHNTELSRVSERPFCYSSFKMNDIVSDSHLQGLICSKTLQIAVSSSSCCDWLALEIMSERRKSPVTLRLESLKMILKRLRRRWEYNIKKGLRTVLC